MRVAGTMTATMDVVKAGASGRAGARLLRAGYARLGRGAAGAGQCLAGRRSRAIAFGAEPELKWARALARIGVDPAMLSGASGHA